MRLLLVRHAQSANKDKTSPKKLRPEHDPGLSELGYAQSEALRDKLVREYSKNKQNLLVITSPMLRCLLTIVPTVQYLSLPSDRCLCHGGCYEYACVGSHFRGTPSDQIVASFPEFTPEGFQSNGLWDYCGSHEREDESECRARCVRIARYLCGRARTLAMMPGRSPATIIFSTHQTIADILCQVLVDGTAESWSYGNLKYSLHNGGVTELSLRPDGKATLHRRDDYAHVLLLNKMHSTRACR